MSWQNCKTHANEVVMSDSDSGDEGEAFVHDLHQLQEKEVEEEYLVVFSVAKPRLRRSTRKRKRRISMDYDDDDDFEQPPSPKKKQPAKKKQETIKKIRRR